MRNLFFLSLLLLAGCSKPVDIDRVSDQDQDQEWEVSAPPPPPPAPVPEVSRGSGSIDFSSRSPLGAADVLIQLEHAMMAFSIPETVGIVETFEAELLIDVHATAQELLDQLREGPARLAQPVLVSRIISARLDAPGFDSAPLTAERQAISTLVPTQWRWRLTATQSGVHEVRLIITAEVTVGAERAQRHIQTLDAVLTVQVTPGQRISKFVSAHWQWLISTLLLPFGLWLYKRRA